MYVSVCVVLEGKGINFNCQHIRRETHTSKVCSQPSELGVLETSKVDSYAATGGNCCELHMPCI